LRKFIGALLLTLIVACSYNLSIPESTLNAYIKKEFPKSEEILLTKVVLKNPELKLIGDNRGELIFDLDINPPIGKEIHLKVDAVGDFLYKEKERTIYLVNLQPKEIRLNGRKFEGGLATKIVNVVVKDVLRGIPVYKIEGEKAKYIKNIKIEKNKLVVTLGI